MVERMLRRGLPRVAGGDPWPPKTTVEETGGAVAPGPVVAETATQAAVTEAPVLAAPEQTPATAQPVATAQPPAASQSAPAPAAAGASVDAPLLRRGLPRTAGGDPWPPSDAAPLVSTAVPSESPTAASSAGPAAAAQAAPAEAPAPVAPSAPATVVTTSATGPALRRGLPRSAGGDAWPPAGTLAVVETVEMVETVETVTPAEASAEVPGNVVAPVAATGAALAPTDASGMPTYDVSTPIPFVRSVWRGQAPRHAAPVEETGRKRPNGLQVISGLFVLAGLGVLALAAVAAVRAILSSDFGQSFLAAYPGEYHLPEGTKPGFAGWIGWQHFFNMFLMVLIIRSGLRVRSEKRPTMFWAPKGDSKGKISLTLWFHQSLDILWLVNGVVFIVLIFVTGHWVRIIPTSWEVFPNAISAGLQYISLDWPTENGWANYNSLQQLAYFATVFIAAPLAAITGFRMSGMWPKKAEKLSKAYPIEWARAVHFPVMIYFIAFIAFHVILVMATGALRNLNHMYASQDLVSWTGFWVFLASLVVVAGAWFAARPLVLAPIAKLFGNVSGR